MISFDDARTLLDAAGRIGDWLARATLQLRRPEEQAAARVLAHALGLVQAARSLEQDFSAQMGELAVLRADWPRERRERLALRVAAFAWGHTRMDAVRHAVAGLRAADRARLPEAALSDVDALAAAGENLVDALGQLASPFGDAQALGTFVDSLMDCADDTAAAALRQRAAHELGYLQERMQGAGLLEPLARLAELLRREHPRVAVIAWPDAAPAPAAGA